ncbi:FlgD immunoglobulin-like domain containing protein [Kamptonema cortianum]|nr:FlgD immunoglobulin-like domain containing protein [Kamptonema cortianum]MDL5055134.1 FlgD immunoglobulin-like domain containing protein [Oscillatoria laete-virens NRMC-F 0139]
MSYILNRFALLALALTFSASCSEHTETREGAEPDTGKKPEVPVKTYQMPEPAPTPEARVFPEQTVDWKADEPGALDVKLEKDARVSLGIYDSDGRLVRELLRGKTMSAGTHRIVWDGLDRTGKALPQGKYEWRMVESPEFTSRYVMNTGTQHKDKPWEYWVADHGGPQAAAIDPEGRLHIGGYGEGYYLWLQLDAATQKRLHSQPQYYDGGLCRDMVYFGDSLYLLQSGLNQAKVRRVKDGAIWDVHWPKDPSQPATGEPSAMDSDGGIFVLSYPERDAVRWIAPADGKLIGTTENLPGARAVAVGKDGTASFALVATKDAIMRLDSPAAAPRKLLDLDGVVAMDIHSDGRIAVARQTPTEAEVRVYSPEFKLMKTFGGAIRPSGVFDQELFSNITEVKFLPDGRLVVLENAIPRRSMILDVASGEKEVIGYGNRTFYAWAKVDPRRPEYHWESMEGALTLFKIDYDQGKWEPVAVWNYRDLLGGLMFAQSADNWGKPWIPAYVKDKFMLLGNGLPASVEVDFKNWKLIPRSFLGSAPPEQDKWPKALKEAVEKSGKDPAQWSRHFNWVDLNGNGQMDADEIELEDGKWNASTSPGSYDRDWNYIHGMGLGQKLLRIPFAEWAGPGDAYPRWRWAGAQETGDLPAWIQGQDMRNVFMDEEGNYFSAMYHGINIHDQLVGRWPGGGFRGAALVGWDRNGAIRFASSGKNNYAHEINTGRLNFPTFIMEGPYQTLLVNDQADNHGPLFTRDGLFVGNLFTPGKNHVIDEKTPEEAYAMKGHRDDNQNAYAVTAQDGRVFFFEGDVGRQRVFEVTGLQGVRRFKGEVTSPATVTPAEQKGTGLTLRLYSDRDKTQLVDTRTVKNLQSEGLFHSLPHPDLKKPFTAELSGYLEPLHTEELTLELRSPQGADRITLWIDGNEVYRSAQNQPQTVTIPVTAGKKNPLQDGVQGFEQPSRL